ncbi:MAG: PTS lactose transporter subunit IIB [Chloroflexota bacterium]
MAKSVAASDIKKIVIACEAGVGSSLMVTNKLKKELKKANIEGIIVTHSPARSVPQDAQVIVVHKGLYKLVLEKAPNAVVLPFSNFMKIPAFDYIIKSILNDTDIKVKEG